MATPPAHSFATQTDEVEIDESTGEGSTSPAMGCFSHAICDSMVVRVDGLPPGYERVWRALKEQRDAERGQGE